MGPFIGNYVFEEAVPLVDLIDQYGLDAIEMGGHVVAWVFDSIEHGLLRPEEVGLSDKPVFDPMRFNPEVDSGGMRGWLGRLLRASLRSPVRCLG